MRIARTLDELTDYCDALRTKRGALALVPTMGALHAGHRSLVAAARQSTAGCVTSIFVNPLQFGAGEDLARYPRDENGDLATLEESGCDLAWIPDVVTMYPPGEATVIDVAGPAEAWEGTARPGHFRGVATVVAKLFGQVRPDLAFFGEKDWQQLQVVRRMVADLALRIKIVGVPIVREADGLALSSRNRFLSPGERQIAPQLCRVLRESARAIRAGQSVGATLELARTRLTCDGFIVDYFDLVDGISLRPIATAGADARLIAAARLGSVRLLDNLGLQTGSDNV